MFKISKEKRNKLIKEYIFIIIGTFIVSAGMFFFFGPSNLSVGGANGLAIVLHNYIPVDVGTIMLGINIILFIVAMLLIGAGFGAKTIIASLLISFEYQFLGLIMPGLKPLTGDLFIELVFGVIISAVGMGIVFNQGASTGGTDIIAKILNKFIGLDLGKGVLMADIAITILAGFTYGTKIGIYSLFGVILNGFVIDWTIEGMNLNKEITIIAEDLAPIEEYIKKDLDRGATIYKGMGAYTKAEKDILVVILDRRDFIALKNFLKGLDQKLFVTVNNTSEVLGYGFKNINE